MLIVPLMDIKALYGLGREHKEDLPVMIRELEAEHDEEAEL